MKLPIPAYNARIFQWIGTNGYIDESELENECFPICGCIYDDACDVGFKVRGKNACHTFAFRENVYNSVGDVFGKLYAAIDTPSNFTITVIYD